MSLRASINLVINSAVAENEDAARVVEHMQARISFEMLSIKTTKKGVDALYRVSSPDLTAFIKDFEGEIPGNKKEECGNYLDHDLAGAKALGAEMYETLKNWQECDLQYK